MQGGLIRSSTSPTSIRPTCPTFQYCLELPQCQYYTWRYTDGSCLPYATCQLDPEACRGCVTSDVDCDDDGGGSGDGSGEQPDEEARKYMRGGIS